MFEKEAKKWVKEHTVIEYKASYGEFPKEPSAIKSFEAGAEFGYNKCKEELNQKGLALQSDMDKTIEQNIALKKELNKANEWHYVKDELPKTDGYYLVFNKGTRSVIIGMFADGHFESCFPYAWKEIVLPELKESE